MLIKPINCVFAFFVVITFLKKILNFSQKHAMVVII